MQRLYPPYMLQFPAIKCEHEEVGGGSPSEQVWTGLQSWPTDVTSGRRGQGVTVQRGVSLYCMVGSKDNGHTGIPSVKGRTRLKTIPSRNLVGGR